MKGLISIVLIFSWLIFFSTSIFGQVSDPLSRRIDSMTLIIENQKEDTNKAFNLLYYLAWDQFNFSWSRGGNYESAIKTANRGLALSKKLNYKWGQGRAYFVLAKCFEEKAVYTESQKYCLEALKISREIGNRLLELNAYYISGRNYNRMSNYSDAVKNLTASLNVAKEIKEENWFSDIISAIGVVYSTQGNYPEAEKYFDEAAKIAESRQEKMRLAMIQLFRGNMYVARHRYDDALAVFFESLKTYRENRAPKSHSASINHAIGNAYCKKAADCTDSLLKRKNYGDAIPYLEYALPIYLQIGVVEGIMKTYASLNEAYHGIGDYKNAWMAADKYSQLKDSVYNKETYVKIGELKFKYEQEKAAAEMNTRREREKIEEGKLRDSMLAAQKLEQQKVLTEEKLTHEREVSREKLIAEKSIASEKVKQQKISAQKQQTNNLLIMGLIMVVVTASLLILFLRQRNQKKRAVEKAEVIRKMAELEMQSLRSQLDPHFMFNSLNSIQTLIMKEQTDKSQSYLSRFAKLLRMLLENADKQFVPLTQEMEFLQLYLGLESLRIPDLQFSISTDRVVDPGNTLIPNMILQPYVENAIWHGLSHKESNKQLQIRIFRENGMMNYEVEDNGVGRKKAAELKSLFRKNHQSKGMELLKKRIALLNRQYGSDIRTEVTDLMSDGVVEGTLVSIKVPVTLFKSLHKQ